MKYMMAVLFLVVSVFSEVRAEVRITEIAWMGNGKSQYGEWFELYNHGASAVNLSGWKLYENNSTVLYSFTKSIAAKSYLVVERVTPSVPDPLPGISGEAGSFGGSGFANTGEHLLLKDPGGTIIHDLDFAGGWPAGDTKEYKTMQWNGSTWITASPTPGEIAPTDGDEGNPIEEGVDNEKLEEVDMPFVSLNDPYIEFAFPASVIKGVPYDFEGKVVLEHSYRVTKGKFYWNMGDGTTVTYSQQEPVRHTYRHPGTYTVSLAYFTYPHDVVPAMKATKKIVVTDPSFTVSMVQGGAFQIENKSDKAMDLSGWSIETVYGRTLFPEMTAVAEKTSVVFPYQSFIKDMPSYVRLINPSGSVVATSEQTPKVSVRNVLAVQAVAEPESPEQFVEQEVGLSTIEEKKNAPKTQNHTKTIVIGVGIVFVIGLCLLLERFMAHQE